MAPFSVNDDATDAVVPTVREPPMLADFVTPRPPTDCKAPLVLDVASVVVVVLTMPATVVAPVTATVEVPSMLTPPEPVMSTEPELEVIDTAGVVTVYARLSTTIRLVPLLSLMITSPSEPDAEDPGAL